MLPLAVLVQRTGLHKATVHRLANELVANRLLDRIDGGYRLSGGLFELGMLASLERSLLEMAMPFLQDLYERTHETVHLGVRDGPRRRVRREDRRTPASQLAVPDPAAGYRCIAPRSARRSWHSPTNEFRREVLSEPMTRRTPHTIVAPGILNTQLNRVVETGIAFEREESAPGLACVAAPVFGTNDKPVAAISVTGPTSRFVPESQVSYVRAAAEGLHSTIARRERLR